ncbi:TPA_exp: Uncharacterized protein A8136_6094 [Trichophyton benhamiae CBS 112371]|uniref:MYND-type domain-containing protein n=1 Tax=Arthroderma benhamiae (strain ATCC MYA-4681 / CBS 112371) TaxID=663331 RepID=D4AQ76_ARTBC|nr:uncharacterized protein ARB_06383 [Trichophyton benhamiae CBS 112371]EFE34620.1 hypothetical protein ARB_06383 [Trichophyton benhamiae CBS 112371]DAA77548.1 TPA_exp: Uncharacterized protein A8136_6094 [Trichophyton benhamiae CBS 112371]
MLLYTLIIDSSDDSKIGDLWNIYNNVLINDTALTLLRSQAKKLVENSKSISDWNGGRYGKTLRFCTQATYSRVVEMWKFYALDPSDELSFNEQQKKLKLTIQKARDLKKQIVGTTRVATGIRSAAPCDLSQIEESHDFYDQFWREGAITPDMSSFIKATHMNPMIWTQSQRLVLHYGTQPLLGFHLAAAYSPLAKGSPLNYTSDGLGDTPAAVRAAFAQFRTYVKAFHNLSSKWILRFVCADALMFCHTLQTQRCGTATRQEYSDNWHFEPFILDPHEYPGQGTGAPYLFDAVDTSNLADHLGPLNILAATGPLLKAKPTSTISTELLVSRGRDTDYLKSLLLGDMVTIGSLFKLTPNQYWTGASVSSNFMERMVGVINKDTGQERYVVRWTRLVTEPITYDPKQLSRLMYSIYLSMFEDENPANLLKLKQNRVVFDEYKAYTRASLCCILQALQRSNVVNWQAFIDEFFGLINQDSNLLMGAHYLQEFYLHLHLSGLHPALTLNPGLDGITARLPQSAFRNWTNIPPALSVTLAIPHEKLSLFVEKPVNNYGTPICQLVFDSQAGQSIFADIQLGFGEVKTLGTKYTEEYAIEIRKDERGWDGTAPLLASVMVPTALILLNPDLSTNIFLGLKTSPATVQLVGKLGMNLAIHESKLANNDVYITRCRPNMEHQMTEHSKIPPLKSSVVPSDSPKQMDGVELKFHLELSSDCSKAMLLTTRLDITSPKYQDILRQGAAVLVEQVSPYKINVRLGGKPFHSNIRLPFPVLSVNTKTRIARKSSYLEFIASIASTGDLTQNPDNVFPIDLYESGPILRNLDYTTLDKLPILDLRDPSKLSWVKLLSSDMFNDREGKERNKYVKGKICTSSDVRVAFKDTLLSLFGYLSGVGTKAQINAFGLDSETSGGVNVIVLMSSLRLEAANQSMVIDAAVIPLTIDLVMEMYSSLHDLTNRGMKTLKISDDELRLWKHVLPAFVDRCRTWKHLPSCEYMSTGKIPLSTDWAQPILCSCGKGKFPNGYEIKGFPEWKDIKKYATRVAISPCYWVPFLDKEFKFDAEDEEHKEHKEGSYKDNKEGLSQITQSLLQSMDLKKGSCSNCGGKKPGSGTKLLRCSGCKVAEYCSKDCQREDWMARHKLACKMMAQMK